MRIGIDARPLSYPLTGIGFYVRSLLDALQSVDRDNHYVLISNKEIDYRITHPNWSKQEGERPEKGLSTAWMQAAAPFLAKRLKLDLFWSPRHHLPLLLPPGVRTVVTIHDLVHLLFPETMFWPNLLLERMLMRLSAISADRIVAVSHATREEILRRYPVARAKVRTVHSGAPPFPPEADEVSSFLHPERYFLFVGTLEPRKNLDRILDAFERLRAHEHGVDLVITGASGWKNEAFMRVLRDSPLRSRVHVTGYVSRGELGRIYRNALGLLFPSLYEGFGFPVLEAMRWGTPVITADRSAMPEVAGGAALLVDPLDAGGIARAMARLMSDEALRSSLSRRGRIRADAFDWQRAAREMRIIFQEVMPT